MRIIEECIYDQEDFNEIGFDGIQIRYERTLKLSGSEAAEYQLYKAVGMVEIFDGVKGEEEFYVVVSCLGCGDDSLDIRTREMWAIPKSLGDFICKQHTLELYLLEEQFEWMTDVDLVHYGVPFPNGMSYEEYDMAVAAGEI